MGSVLSLLKHRDFSSLGGAILCPQGWILYLITYKLIFPGKNFLRLPCVSPCLLSKWNFSGFQEKNATYCPWESILHSSLPLSLGLLAAIFNPVKYLNSGYQNSCVPMRWERSSLSSNGWVTLEALFATSSRNAACQVPKIPQGDYLCLPSALWKWAAEKWIHMLGSSRKACAILRVWRRERASQIVSHISKKVFLLLSILINFTENIQ